MTDTLYTNWAMPFINALGRAGVHRAVISPGSRSTPLTLAALSCAHMQCDVIVDERSAAFFALGQIRATGRPTVLICTSGSAGAHYFPAIVEAALTHLPLLILTADRPFELQQCGANQTTQQQHWYGHHVKASFELGEPPDKSDSTIEAAAIRIATQAVHSAMSPARGPVHINARFRKPLAPKHWPIPVAIGKKASPFIAPSHYLAADAAIQYITDICNRHKRGIIVCGPGPMHAAASERAASVHAFAKAAGYPVIAEIAASITGTKPPSMQHGSTWFMCRETPLPVPDLIIEIHRPLTATAYERFIGAHPEIPRVIISEDEYVDFTGTADAVFTGSISDTLNRCIPFCTAPNNADWLMLFEKFDSRCAAEISAFIASAPFCEATAIRQVLSGLAPHHVLCVGNSMVIRDADLFSPAPDCHTVLHQRGASGIDGLISGAAGVASVTDSGVLAIVGDVSALHDLGGFALLALVSGPLTIVIVHNDGGQIFSQLPLANVAGLDSEIRSGFIVPGTPSFKGVCEMFNLTHRLATDSQSVAEGVRHGMQSREVTVIEARVHPDTEYRKRFIANLEQSLRDKPLL